MSWSRELSKISLTLLRETPACMYLCFYLCSSCVCALLSRVSAHANAQLARANPAENYFLELASCLELFGGQVYSWAKLALHNESLS